MTREAFRRIYLDSTVLICAVETSTAEAQMIWRLIFGGLRGGYGIIVSEFALTEVLVHPIQQRLIGGSGNLVDGYMSLISDSASTDRVVHLNRDILIQAVELRARSRLFANKSLKTPDALHLACALAAQCDTFITGDRALADAIRHGSIAYGEAGPTDAQSLLKAVDLSAAELTVLAEELACP